MAKTADVNQRGVINGKDELLHLLLRGIRPQLENVTLTIPFDVRIWQTADRTFPSRPLHTLRLTQTVRWTWREWLRAQT